MITTGVLLRVKMVAASVALIGVTLIGAAPLGAQTDTIAPGMTEAQVIARLGRPASTRSFQSFTYLFYQNGCEKKCGMNDLVTLDSGRVVDAVFRSSRRHYSGTSSSPRAIPAAEARKGKPDAPLSVPVTSTPNTQTAVCRNRCMTNRATTRKSISHAATRS